ncbi:hypothetical protein KUL156_29200 [Alteromonas sp. KUL156]|nr:hypothetical protein KUL154_51580 [Alteromonas sp. KUL154]GFE00328.1 hypothetical protein KUL156_29200 [Alteromonas sp. KUL156]
MSFSASVKYAGALNIRSKFDANVPTSANLSLIVKESATKIKMSNIETTVKTGAFWDGFKRCSTNE